MERIGTRKVVKQDSQYQSAMSDASGEESEEEVKVKKGGMGHMSVTDKVESAVVKQDDIDKGDEEEAELEEDDGEDELSFA